ncbi:hypothetical protein METSCH_A05710 [Metschnikowia aff. pulcherrima]|uniref:Uncharacterized protein n=1 Tax=Metschnikowia aff. pulcherrima TaxID=2163413 RepID=A0A4P6XFA3_9ASCO|nr:hypothetical protein METSCH_A05710 [Metschnikowia aff. pulcherrima]
MERWKMKSFMKKPLFSSPFQVCLWSAPPNKYGPDILHRKACKNVYPSKAHQCLSSHQTLMSGLRYIIDGSSALIHKSGSIIAFRIKAKNTLNCLRPTTTKCISDAQSLGSILLSCDVQPTLCFCLIHLIKDKGSQCAHLTFHKSPKSRLIRKIYE